MTRTRQSYSEICPVFPVRTEEVTEVYHNSMPPKTEVSVVYPHRASTADHHT